MSKVDPEKVARHNFKRMNNYIIFISQFKGHNYDLILGLR